MFSSSKIITLLVFLVVLLFVGFVFTVFCYLRTRDNLLLEKTRTASFEILVESINNAEIKTQKCIKEVKEKSASNDNVKVYLNVSVPYDIVNILHKSHLSAIAKTKN